MSRPTNDSSIDTFRIEYVLGPSAILALIFNHGFNFIEVPWAFSIYLEAVAILPQLFILQRTGEAETITTHYLAALGAYRALYIPNWIYRYVGLYALDISLRSRLEPTNDVFTSRFILTALYCILHSTDFPIMA